MRWRGLRTSLQVFSPCNYYAGVATTSNAVSFRSLWSKSVLQELVRSYHTRTRRYSRYTVQTFATSFLRLCASVRPVFLVYSPHILPRDWRELFWIIVLAVEKIGKVSRSYPQNLNLACLKWSILETVTDIAKSSCQSLEKVAEITLLPRLEWNLAWEDLNCARKIEQVLASCSPYIFSWLCVQRCVFMRPVSRNLKAGL